MRKNQKDALFKDFISVEPGQKIGTLTINQYMSLDAISWKDETNKYVGQREIDNDKVIQLITSLLENLDNNQGFGLDQPICVTKFEGKYLILDGQHRHSAIKHIIENYKLPEKFKSKLKLSITLIECNTQGDIAIRYCRLNNVKPQGETYLKIIKSSVKNTKSSQNPKLKKIIESKNNVDKYYENDDLIDFKGKDEKDEINESDSDEIEEGKLIIDAVTMLAEEYSGNIASRTHRPHMDKQQIIDAIAKSDLLDELKIETSEQLFDILDKLHYRYLDTKSQY